MAITLGKGDQTQVLKRDGSTDTVLDFRSIYFDITLTPDQETGIVNSKAEGTGIAVLNESQDELSFSLQVSGIDLDGKQTASGTDNMTAAHFHTGVPGVSGPPVFGFDNDESTVVNGPAGTIDGLWDASENLSGANLTNLLNDGLYVNVHTGNFPAGEIRGQVLQQDEGNDRIDLRELNIGNMAQLKSITRDVGGSAQISFDFDSVETRLTLAGVSESMFDASHFIFAGKAGTETGTTGGDDLFAAKKGSTLNGLGGNDRLSGGNADDDLSGGNGRDILFGGKGQDNLDGGAGADRFLFKSVKDSSATALDDDVIVSFETGKDTIDLSKIDAMAGTAGNQAFTYINEDPFTGEGQIRQYIEKGVAITEINTSGVDGAEMVFTIANGVKWELSDLDA